MDIMDVMKLAQSAGVAEQIGKMAGIPEDSVGAVVESVLPLLIQGMQGQAKNAKTQKSFLKALEDHGKKDTKDITKFFGDVDVEDGAKIVKHLLGAGSEEVAAKAKKKSGIDTKTIMKIMAILAPLLMSKMGSTAKKSKKKDDDDMLSIVSGLLDGVDANDVIKLIGKLI